MMIVLNAIATMIIATQIYEYISRAELSQHQRQSVFRRSSISILVKVRFFIQDRIMDVLTEARKQYKKTILSHL